MNFFKDAADIQTRMNRSPLAIGFIALVTGISIYTFHWKDDPYRDGAEQYVRRDAATKAVTGDIRRVNLKTTLDGSCQAKCPGFVFLVVGSRAILRVSVAS